MALIPVTLSSGRTVQFEVDTRAYGPAYFVLSVRKCGSSLFNQLCAPLARLNKHTLVEVGNTFFRANIREVDYASLPALRDLIYPGNVYAGFRTLPSSLCGHDDFEKGLKVMMVRDPRDALVSLYFSTAFSHPIPAPTEAGGDDVARTLEKQRVAAQQTSIEDFVKSQARPMLRTMLSYRRIMRDPSLTVFRYEDYIFDKRQLLLSIAASFGWETNDQEISLILEWADVRPQEENPHQFIRKVTPGDHKEKLDRAVIADITEILRPAMDMFGYEP